MDTVESGTRSTEPSAARPSLFGNGRIDTNVKPAEPISILSSLDKNDGKKSLTAGTGLPTWFTIAVGSLLGITIGAAIVMSLTRDTGVLPHKTPLAAVVARAPEPAPPAPALPPLAPAVEQSAAATIENAPPASVAPTSAPAQPPAAVVAGAAPAIEAVAPAPQVAKPTSPPSAEPAPAAHAKPAAVERPEPKPERVVASAKPKGKDAKAEAASAAPAAPANDRDASLIAALVAYGEGKPATEINASAAPLAAKPTAAKPQAAGTTVAQTGKGEFDPKRDVVTRDPALSTGELVRRCRTLGFFEGQLCLMRVCSNLWGKDPACPQSAAPQAERGGP